MYIHCVLESIKLWCKFVIPLSLSNMCVLCFRPLRDDEKLPIRTHHIVPESSQDKEQEEQNDQKSKKTHKKEKQKTKRKDKVS